MRFGIRRADTRNAPKGAQRARRLADARKESNAARGEHSSLWRRAGEVNYNINLKAEGLGPSGSPKSRPWLRPAEAIALFWSRGRIFDAISGGGV